MEVGKIQKKILIQSTRYCQNIFNIITLTKTRRILDYWDIGSNGIQQLYQFILLFQLTRSSELHVSHLVLYRMVF